MTSGVVAEDIRLAIDGFRTGIRRLWLPAAATVLFWVACALPLFFSMRELHAHRG